MEEKNLESPVRTLRIKTGVSQRQMADALEVHHSMIAGLEAGVIEIEEDAALVENKIGKVFDNLSDWSGIPKEELVKKQAEYNKNNAELIQGKAAEKIQDYVKQQIRRVAEDESGSETPKGEEVDWLIEFFKDACKEERISPVSWFRNKAQITQRQLAMAAGVKQTLVTRLELGEVNMFGLNTGIKLLKFLLDALGYRDPLEDGFDNLYSSIYECQEEFIKDNAKKAKEKIKSSLEWGQFFPFSRALQEGKGQKGVGIRPAQGKLLKSRTYLPSTWSKKHCRSTWQIFCSLKKLTA